MTFSSFHNPSHLYFMTASVIESKRDSRHQHSIWQDIQAKNIYSMDFLQQKIEYIHQNPVAKDWKLVEDRADYIYSSAGYYDYGRKSVIEITDLNEWLTSTPSSSPANGAYLK